MYSVLRVSAFCAAMLAFGCCAHATIVINQFLPIAGPTTPGLWYESDVRPGGTASVVDLTGMGGDLENNQPLPIGAALLTTDLTSEAKAEVATFDDFGDAASVLGNLNIGYSYYKQTVVGGNTFAAPSLKLAVFSPVGTGDNFGQLIYEPNWNQPGGGSQAPPADAWQHLALDSDTGGGDGDGSGGWWWSGGFNIVSGAGGPPIRSLNEWVTAFQASDPTDFATARIVSIAMGVGTFNQGQVGYFDNVNYAVTGGLAETWNFEPVPEPATLVLAGLALVGLVGFVRRRK